MPLFPRYGKARPDNVLKSSPQLQETFGRGNEQEEEGFGLRELTMSMVIPVRAVPLQFFVPGAPAVVPEAPAEVGATPVLGTDVS